LRVEVKIQKEDLFQERKRKKYLLLSLARLLPSCGRARNPSRRI